MPAAVAVLLASAKEEAGISVPKGGALTAPSNVFPAKHRPSPGRSKGAREGSIAPTVAPPPGATANVEKSDSVGPFGTPNALGEKAAAAVAERVAGDERRGR
jgi:hypothetical protein